MCADPQAYLLRDRKLSPEIVAGRVVEKNAKNTEPKPRYTELQWGSELLNCTSKQGKGGCTGATRAEGG